jgi:hypothetical protein
MAIGLSVCMCVCMCVCVYICVCVFAGSDLEAGERRLAMATGLSMCMCVCMCVCVFADVHMYVCVCARRVRFGGLGTHARHDHRP